VDDRLEEAKSLVENVRARLDKFSTRLSQADSSAVLEALDEFVEDQVRELDSVISILDDESGKTDDPSGISNILLRAVNEAKTEG